MLYLDATETCHCILIFCALYSADVILYIILYFVKSIKFAYLFERYLYLIAS